MKKKEEETAAKREKRECEVERERDCQRPLPMLPSMRDLTGHTTAPSQGVEDERQKGERGDGRRLQERRREGLNGGLMTVCYRCRHECEA